MSSVNVLPDVQALCLHLLRVPPAKVVANARLIEDLDMDSLFAAELGLALERKFQIEVPEEAILSFRTVADIADYVKIQLNQPAA